MNYIVSAITDMGTTQNTNQDSMSVKMLNTSKGRMIFAVLCDGMGGLSKGELASATVVRAFNNWMEYSLPQLIESGLEDYMIRVQWEKIIASQNQMIMNYGKRNRISLGTTVTAMLLTDNRYYIINVGDTRAYELYDCVQQITEDQTVVADEIRKGKLSSEEAEMDPRRNMLLQCVGASKIVYPDMFFGEIKRNAAYMLCSDGFRHEIIEAEIWQAFMPEKLLSQETMENNIKYLIELNKRRNERDNISVILVRTF